MRHARFPTFIARKLDHTIDSLIGASKTDSATGVDAGRLAKYHSAHVPDIVPVTFGAFKTRDGTEVRG